MNGNYSWGFRTRAGHGKVKIDVCPDGIDKSLQVLILSRGETSNIGEQVRNIHVFEVPSGIPIDKHPVIPVRFFFQQSIQKTQRIPADTVHMFLQRPGIDQNFNFSASFYRVKTRSYSQKHGSTHCSSITIPAEPEKAQGGNNPSNTLFTGFVSTSCRLYNRQ